MMARLYVLAAALGIAIPTCVALLAPRVGAAGTIAEEEEWCVVHAYQFYTCIGTDVWMEVGAWESWYCSMDSIFPETCEECPGETAMNIVCPLSCPAIYYVGEYPLACTGVGSSATTPMIPAWDPAYEGAQPTWKFDCDVWESMKSGCMVVNPPYQLPVEDWACGKCFVDFMESVECEDDFLCDIQL